MPGMRCRLLIMVTTWGVLFTGASSAHAASGLFDWLANCGSNRETPVTWYYPVTSTYVGSSTDCCEPTVCCDVPCPPLVMPEQRPSLWQRLFGCCGSAQTSYRTNWTQIPVTSYRPAVTTDPITGCPVTVMQPCTTYMWQADRQRCGLLDRLCGRCDPPPTAVPCYSSGVVYGGVDCGGGVVTSDCCGETVPSQVPSQVPTPAAPAPTPAPYYAPGGSAGSSVLPRTNPPVTPPNLSPQGPSPPAGGGAPQPPTTPPAAGTRPALKPADTPPAGPVLEEPAPQTPLPSQSASAADVFDPNTVVPLPSRSPSHLNGQGPGVSPVPDPDTAPADSEAQPSPPQLLNPRDQVALLRTGQTWSYNTITWPAQRTVVPARQSPIPTRPDRRWDESGWQSARQ